MSSTGEADPWVGTAEIAVILDCPLRRVQRSLSTPQKADVTWGKGMWTDRARGALSVKKVYGVRRSVVLQMAKDAV